MSFLARLSAGLAQSSAKLSESLSGVFASGRLDDAAVEALEEALIEADLGPRLAADLAGGLAKERFGKEVTVQEARRFLARRIEDVLRPVAAPLAPDFSHCPCVILVVGVNGNGKTTTIGKIAARFKGQGKSVMLAAADTFRAAAGEQLHVWSERTGASLVTGTPGADPASVAYQALEEAKAVRTDLLLVDTAGRLHNKANLMEELQKIIRVLRKLDPSAPHHVLQVLDATTGQNALAQVKAFSELTDVDGLIVTKLDGTAKGGVVVALAREFGLPIHYVGVGEDIEDLDVFQPSNFAENLTK